MAARFRQGQYCASEVFLEVLCLAMVGLVNLAFEMGCPWTSRREVDEQRH